MCKGSINNIKGIFLLDTGASISCLDLEKKAHYGIDSVGETIEAMDASGNNISASPTGLCRLKLGRYYIGEHPFMLFDMSSINSGLAENKCSPVDGFIGGSLLKELGAQIDYRTMTLRFGLQS